MGVASWPAKCAIPQGQPTRRVRRVPPAREKGARTVVEVQADVEVVEQGRESRHHGEGARCSSEFEVFLYSVRVVGWLVDRSSVNLSRMAIAASLALTQGRLCSHVCSVSGRREQRRRRTATPTAFVRVKVGKVTFCETRSFFPPRPPRVRGTLPQGTAEECSPSTRALGPEA